MALIKIDHEEQFQNILENTSEFLFLKHSLTCPISAAAFEEFNQYIANHPEIDTYYLAVQEARPLSNTIAEQFQIKHESPQIFFFKDGKVEWHTSHRNITRTAIEEIVG